MLCSCSFVFAVLQKLKGPDSLAGCQSGGLQCHLQREAAQKERAQAEDHSSGWGSHRAWPAE